MKFFHLSDLHIGLKLMNRDLREDQEYILAQIVEMARKERLDAVVIAGDIYDKAVPSAEAVDVFDHFTEALMEAVPDVAVMMISGNHDSSSRVNCFRGILSRQKLHMVGIPPRMPEERIERVTLADDYGNVNFYLLPFVRPSMIRNITGTDENGRALTYDQALRCLLEREMIDQEERNVLVSHQFYLPEGKQAEEVQRMDSEIVTVGNIDQVSGEVLKCFDYAALGHIHKPMTVGGEQYRYCGTPLACSVSEAGQQKGIVMVELREKAEAPRITVLPFNPLRRVSVVKGSLAEVLEQACDDYVTVILTEEDGAQGPDLQDRIRAAFPHLLEIRREHVRRPDYSHGTAGAAGMDPMELCSLFLPGLDEAEREILQDVVNQVKEANA